MAEQEDPFKDLDPSLSDLGKDIVEQQSQEISEIKETLQVLFQELKRQAIGKSIIVEESDNRQTTVGHIIPLDNNGTRNLVIIDSDLFIVEPPEDSDERLNYELDFNPKEHSPLAFTPEEIKNIYQGKSEGLTVTQRTTRSEDLPAIREAYQSLIHLPTPPQITNNEETDQGLACVRDFISAMAIEYNNDLLFERPQGYQGKHRPGPTQS